MMMVVPVEDIYVEALQVKYPIIDWEDLVKERFGTTKPTDDKEKELWVELKRLFEPDSDDTIWKLQRYMHDPLVWRLYDTCGVHHVSSVRGHDIFMLVEKEYPLTRELMTAILASSSEVPSVLEFLQRRKLEAKKEVAASEFSHLNHSLSHRPVSVKPDISKPDISKASSAGGKLHILKPSCERNGITPTPKESLSPTSGSKVPNSPLTGESNLLIVKASAD
ncbi:hypothetical protein Tco_0530412 [Tanacetum coccineum]